MKPESHQAIESIGFLVAVIVAAIYGISEAGVNAGLLHPDPAQHHGVPWGVVLCVFALVLPKTLGRATAGDIWRIGLKALWRPRGSGSFPQPQDDGTAQGGATAAQPTAGSK